jgi:hypothetical protein
MMKANIDKKEQLTQEELSSKLVARERDGVLEYGCIGPTPSYPRAFSSTAGRWRLGLK